MEYVIWICLGLFAAIILITINIQGNDTDQYEAKVKSTIALSNNSVISKLIEEGYNPIVVGCALDNNPTACTILASKIDQLTEIKQEIK